MPSHAAIRLLAASSSALYLELVLIRWIGGEAPVLAYFKNFPLLAAFLGMGVGARLATSKRALAPLAPVALGLLALALVHADWFGLTAIAAPDPGLPTWTLRKSSNAQLGAVLGLGLLTLMAVGFLALGQAVGRLLDEAGPRLRAYGTDLQGGLLGVLLALAASGSGLPPALLFVPGVLVFAASVRREERFVTFALAALFAVAVPLENAKVQRLHRARWSPYSRLQLTPYDPGNIQIGEALSANHSWYQLILDLSDASLARVPHLVADHRAAYVFNYDALGFPDLAGRRVLIGGAGTGNDVAAALRRGAGEVVAVEIDPEIAALGRARHPERPYSSPRVRLLNDDARAAFRGMRGAGFDVLIYSLIDSHAALAALGSLRHEDYIYTVEGIQAGLGALGPTGVAAMTFEESDRLWIGSRIATNIERATGSPPVVVSGRGKGGWIHFFYGPGLDREATRQRLAQRGRRDEGAERLADRMPPTTDDWPFLYLDLRQPPRIYLASLAGMVLVTIAAIVLTSSRDAAGASRRPTSLDLEMGLLGAAFMVLEIKGITELARLFGATWLVTGIVLASIFAVLVTANAIASRLPPRLAPWLGGATALALLAPVVLPLDLVALGPAVRVTAAALFVGLPVGLGGLCFSSAFARVEPGSGGRAFGFNLAGAALGGGLEALSLFFGLRALSLAGAALYITWGIVHARGSRGQPTS